MKIDKVPDNQAFIRLIQMARDDAEIKESLMALCQLEVRQRKETLNKIVATMKQQQEDEDIVQAMMCLQYDTIAEKVKAFLT